MSPLADPENPPVPSPCPSPCPCQCRCRCPCQDRHRARGRCRLLLAIVAAAVAAAALGAAAAAAAFLALLRGEPPPEAATAAHALLSAGSLSAPPGPLWRYERGIHGVFLSGDVRGDPAGTTLRVARGGLYLLYAQFGLTCAAPPCPPGTATLRLLRAGSRRPLLAVPLSLPGGLGAHRARSGLAQAVGQLDTGDILSVEVVGDSWAEGGHGGGWQLAQDEREGNFVGLLRIAGG